MRFIAQRLEWSGKLFLACSVLLIPAFDYIARWYIDNNLRKFGLSLLGWDSCYFPMMLAAILELALTGLVLLIFAALIGAANNLGIKISK
jgi:hypothetical protein